jgi:hypothetical protein
MDNQKILQSEQNKPFNIASSFVPNPLSKMNKIELDNSLRLMNKYSPFFQKENLYKDTSSEKIIRDLNSIKKIDSFINYIPLSTSMNAYISIAGNIATRIKANDDQYKEISEYLLQDVLKNSMIGFQLRDLEVIVDRKLNKYKESSELNNDIEKFLNDNQIEKNDKNKRIVKDILINKYTATFLRNETDKLISKNFDKIVAKANETRGVKEKIEFKDPKQSAKNDYVVMGAPASGKGAVTGKLFTESERKNSIILNPDSYRVFTENLIKNKKFSDSEIKSNNMAITADFADYVQENVIHAIKTRKDHSGVSVISDKPKYKKEIEDHLKKDTKIIIASYYGHPTHESGIAFRNKNRGDTAPNIIDKRHFNTKDILGIHKEYFDSFIGGAPFKFDVEIVDVVGKDLTGEWGKPNTIATISSETNQLKINDPIAFVEFVNKSNINEKAKHPIEVSLLNKNPQEKIESKIKAFENFCKIAEDRGLKIDGKENVISDFREREERIIGRINQSSSSSIAK